MKREYSYDREAYRRVHPFMARTWPAVFANQRHPLPLKLGIDSDIEASGKLPSEVSQQDVVKFIAGWTQRREYLIEQLLQKDRFDLDGAVADVIHPTQREYCMARLCRSLLRAANDPQRGTKVIASAWRRINSNKQLRDQVIANLFDMTGFCEDQAELREKVWPWSDPRLLKRYRKLSN